MDVCALCIDWWCNSGEKNVRVYFDELKLWIGTKEFLHSHQTVKLNGLLETNDGDREKESLTGAWYFMNYLEISNLKLNSINGKWWLSLSLCITRSDDLYYSAMIKSEYSRQRRRWRWRRRYLRKTPLFNKAALIRTCTRRKWCENERTNEIEWATERM